jgi:hypothetical protein
VRKNESLKEVSAEYNLARFRGHFSFRIVQPAQFLEKDCAERIQSDRLHYGQPIDTLILCSLGTHLETNIAACVTDFRYPSLAQPGFHDDQNLSKQGPS